MSGAGPVRLAVVGVGHLGRKHVRVAAGIPGIALVGVHDRLDERAEEVSREEGLPVLANPDEVVARAEAVVVATPTISHAGLAGFFLERGLDVLVEKPMTASLAEADALVALARARGRVLEVGHVERYNPAVGAVLDRVTGPLFIEGHRLGAPTERSLDIDVVLDLMIHDLQIVSALVRRPVREVRAAGMPVLTNRVDIANARIEFEGGCVANLTASRVSTEPMRKLRIFAPPIYCSIDMKARSVAAHRLVRDGARAGVIPEAIPVEAGDPLGRELADFAAAVRERRDPLVSGEVGRDALALAERVAEAIESHRRSAGADL
ncbi:MAG TPA: Gfo/Idh/MocA family oxidoreductase [Thermoanaerobaculia bacterium]|jgi:predicted dehydrogenase|nr:Gfo/Idh/MocA family oxidoreductase [Thermoanaerobaculia bacterium]